ncbi:MAG: DUF4097 family beta strand repeat protein [Clostridia bacterium]|nr:DUF4097 family beta strand repeat protein [Clostridia bacterium]
MKKGFIVVAVVLVAVGIALFAVACILFGFDFSKLDTAKYETNTYTASNNFESIIIKADEADIAFKLSENGKLRVDCVERENVKHEVSVENGTLKIIAVDKRVWYDYLTGFSFKPQSITVYLPSKNYKDMTISTDTGDVSVPPVFSFADAAITASTGDVSCEASVEGCLKINTSTGDIRTIGVRATTIDLSASTGRIDVQNIDCKDRLSVKVSTGKIFLTDVVCKSLISNGSTGDITLKNVVASDSFQVERSTGDVRFEDCDAGQIAVRTSTGDVTGTLRSEKVFVTKTSTGHIDVPDMAFGGRCEIATSTGDIRITVLN